MTDPRPLEALTDEELDRYVRRAIVQGLVGLCVVFVVLGVVGVVFKPQLLAVTGWVHDTVGLLGLCILNFCSDALVTPIPPDFALLIISRSPLAPSWPWLVPALGLLSSVAGCCGYILARSLARTRVPRLLLGRVLVRNGALVERYGGWAVAIGALTPVPFSVTCWSAGLLGMRFQTVALLTLLRVPRFVAYYAAIAYADVVIGALF